ncbi:hypothetical protein F0562_001536 [Nyssa sinensis]|uniref:Protein kinase domain-containing protein n=1 Tax=Nyssa sinensis TaxID=561372 RepID=A0A5J5C7F9_9ASTE|nr:hypothetical protein F0562_001536 [Nyssa sinensis]
MMGVLLTALLLYILPQFPRLYADEGSFSLVYNGGKIMTQPVTVSLLWLGTEWQESGQQAIRNAIFSLTPSRYHVKDSEVPTLGNWWETIRQYRDGSNVSVTDRVDVGAECFYKGPQLNMTLDLVTGIGRSVFSKTSIDGFGGNLTCTQLFEVNDSTIYHVVFSPMVTFLSGKEQMELMFLCSGNFPVEVSAGKNVKMAWARPQQTPGDQCLTFFQGDYYRGPPNDDEKIDSLVGFMLAKIAEEVTNPDGRGWISNDGSDRTVSSSCVSIFMGDEAGPPLFNDMERNVSFNAVGLNGYRYMVQYIWDQKIRNCALQPSETCGTNVLTFKQPKGYLKIGTTVNQTNGLQPYSPNQKCRWKIQYPTAKFISFTINYLSVAENTGDQVMICQSDSGSAQCSTIQSNAGNFDKNFNVIGSKAYVEFTSGDHVSFESRGWELSYSAGFCNGKEDVYDQEGVIGYKSAVGYSYVEGLSCQWVLHGKPGTLVTLSFTHINISKDFDFLAIYNGTMLQMANFSGIYWRSDLPLMNLTGEVMIAFATQTDKGEGWSANFYISSPVDRSKKTLLIVAIVILAVVGISLSIALITLAFVRRRSKHTTRMDLNENSLLIRAEVNGEENKIGEGPSSIVYRAESTDGISMAIKSPKDSTSQTKLEEEILIKTSSHPNIISLVGYAEDGIRGRYLVFEFMGRGSLSWNLNETGGKLDWEKRLEIAIQISSAIQMLHMYLKPPISHGNITSENILLDECYNAKLGGFGAANYCTSDGTNPEMPSEMAEDIWSFGLLLVELLRGEPLVNRNASEFFESLEKMNKLLGGQECLDLRLGIPEEECKIRALAKLGEIAKWCIGSSQGVGGGVNSPKIGDVVSGLNQVKQLFFSVSG